MSKSPVTLALFTLLFNSSFALVPVQAAEQRYRTSVLSSISIIEPLSEDTLEIYSRLLPNLHSPHNITHVAGYLHRYGNPKGTEALIEQLKQHDNPSAAAVLALSQDPQLLPDILRSFQKQGQNHQDLISALGQWHDVRITEELLKRAKTGRMTKELALALASHKDPRSIPFLRHRLTDEISLIMGAEPARRVAFAICITTLNRFGSFCLSLEKTLPTLKAK